MRNTHPLLHLTRVRFLEFLREPEAVFWTFLFPVLLTAGLGVAFRSRAPDVVTVAVVEGPYATATVEALSRDSTVRVIRAGRAAVDSALQVGRVVLAIEASGATRVRYLLDPTRPEARQARLVVDRALQVAAGATPRVDTEDVAVSEPGSRYVDFVLPGLLGMNLMGSGIWGIGFSIVDARRKKLLKRLAATPMRRSHYLLSFLLMRLGLMVVEVSVIVAFGHWAFGVPVRGSVASLALVVLSGTLAFGGLGLLIASRAQTVEAASGLMNVVMMPMWVGSGVFFAASRFPDVIQPFVQALPLTAVVDALRLSMLQGATIGRLAPELLILAAWLVVTFTLAVWRFRWR